MMNMSTTLNVRLVRQITGKAREAARQACEIASQRFDGDLLLGVL